MGSQTKPQSPVLSSAHWTSLHTGVVSLQRDWKRKKMPPLFWGRDRIPLHDVKPAPLTIFGEHAAYYCSGSYIIFMLRANRMPNISFEEEKLYLAGPFSGWNKAIGKAKWRLQSQEIDGETYFVLRKRKKSISSDAVEFKFVTGTGRWLEVPSDAPNVHHDPYGNRNYQFQPERTGKHVFQFTTPRSINQSGTAQIAYVEGDYEETTTMQAGVFLKTLESPMEQGVKVLGGITRFRIFAPRANSVKLFLFEKLDDPEPEPIRLRMIDGMTWEASVAGNRHGWYYYYKIDGRSIEGATNFDPNFRILDPYALAVVGPLGPAIVIDHGRLPRTPRPFRPPWWHDLVICEAHVRDLTKFAPIAMSEVERRGFTGLRKWVEHESFYLKELGFNAVELQPIQENDAKSPEQYHWGYMTCNYFSPASQYATDPAKATQIEEFRELVDAFHRQGMAVILDVVYNHVGEPNYLQYIDKQYYFLLSRDGEYMNFSGCGNTLDCDAPMARRLMIESLIHLVRTYDVDGFRFDLGELVGRDALADVEQKLKAVKPSVVVIAEPWSFRGHIAHQLKETGVASWNDGYREFIREYVTGKGNADGLRYYLQGSREMASFPAQTVNYVESHDDRCWMDKITENRDHNGYFPTFNDRRRTHLMMSIMSMAVGIPMLNSGMDMLKSKHGINNTYQREDLNAIPYTRAIFYSGTHEYFRNWIRFRRSEWGRLIRLYEHPRKDYYQSFTCRSALGMVYNANGQLGSRRLFFTINPHFEIVRMEIPEGLLDGYTQVADHERFDGHGIHTAQVRREKNYLELMPLSCALWVKA